VGTMVTHRTLRVGMHICIPPFKAVTSVTSR